MSRASTVVLGLISGAAVFGLLAPFALANWALLYLFSLGSAPSPGWGLLSVAALLALLGWLAWRSRSNAFIRSLFVGALLGILGVLVTVPILARNAKERQTEREQVVFSGSSPLESLQVLDSSAQAVWRIAALGEPQIVKPLRYGVVPEGFRQEVPHRGRPRFFRVDESLVVEARTVSGVESRTGRASSSDGIQVLQSRGDNRPATQLRSPQSP